MTKEIFEKLVQDNESSVLDFKLSEYDFSSNAHESKKAEFIKDIISFTNTVRKETSYIIIGIEEFNNKNILKGVPHTTDDSILQQKIKNCVFPIPCFRYYPFFYKNMIFGIIEFPIKKYEKPISPIVKLKGLNPGTIYFRRNSINDEANHLEVIEINKWLNSLANDEKTFQEIIQEQLFKIITESESLSKILIELLSISKKFDVPFLTKFCEREIKGLIKDDNYEDEDIPILNYRTKLVTISPYEINLCAVTYYNSTQLLQVLRHEHGAWEQNLLLQYSVFKIESYIKNYPVNENTLLQIKDSINDEQIFIYFDKQTLLSYYHSIKEELKNILLNLL